MAITLEQVNTAPREAALQLLDGLYEHSPWVAETALAARPFQSLAQLKYVMAEVLQAASQEKKLRLIRAHPELAGKAMPGQNLTATSASEQGQAGLSGCTPEEFERLQQLNADYNAKFGFPFILAVRGPRGTGLNRQQIIATFARRLQNPPDFELQECLRQIHRIAELRLNDRFAAEPTLGNDIWDWQEQLAQYSDAGCLENGQLTVTYLTDAHRACAQFISNAMQDCGFDEVSIDAVGNVVGVYRAGPHPNPLPAGEGVKTLLTGSHYDTVRNAGKYDGRLGVFVPLACVRELRRQGRRLLFNLEVVAFAEEEGQRYQATFLGSGALTGDFRPEWLEQTDADGVTLRQAMLNAGLAIENIARLKRNPANYLGFVEVHVEQGPVLGELNIPLGVVTSINAGVRFLCEITGMASHAGTTPMNRRRDAATGAAELALHVERRAAQDGDSVGTIGLLQVPNGSINVVPGRCTFSLDLRAPNDAQRNALTADVLAELKAICQRRGLSHVVQETLRAAAAPCASALRQRWEHAVQALGVPLHRMPSGAGHDAMKLHEIMPQAMLFVRGENSGISHNPLESTTSDDMQLAAQAFLQFLNSLASETP
jgi:N-carbamoyl-L-amino-acid hydrolase